MLPARSPNPTASSICCTLTATSRKSAAEEPQRQRHVLKHAEVGQHVKGLEHEAQVAAPQARARIVGELREVLPVQRDAAAVGLVETRQ